MSNRDGYAPGKAGGAEIQKDGDKWTLLIVRELRHPPTRVWTAITEPEHLRQWAPYDADRTLGAVGTVTLTTVGAPSAMQSTTEVRRAEPPKLLELSWGGQDMRWELEPLESGGTRLRLWHNIHKNYIAMGAAGWHVCLDVLDQLLAGTPIGRLVGADAMQFQPWHRLHAEYAELFGVSTGGQT
ncbi:MAG: SRPBCC family protein [Myxococcota bacterium]